MKLKFPKKSDKIRPLLQEFKQNLIEIYGNNLINIILFGSYSRGDFNQDSDIDVLIVLEKLINPYDEIDRISDIKFDFMLKHNLVISCIFTDENKFDRQIEPIFFNIKKEGILI